MTYAESGQGYRGEPGFRDEPDFRAESTGTTPYQAGRYPVDDYSSELPESAATAPYRPVSAAELDGVFDDPDHGDPGSDRMGIHIIWEILLLLGLAGTFALFWQTHRAGVTGTALHSLLLSGASLGLIATGAALSLRAGAVNLAVGPIAAGAALFFAMHSDRNLPATVGLTVLMALAAGAVIAVLVVAFQVPGWAASLAGALAVVVWIQKHPAAATNMAAYNPLHHAYYWFGGFAALSLIGGVLGVVKPIRRAVGRFRPMGDPAERRGFAAAAVAFVAILGSSVLAAGGGILLALGSRSVAPTDGFLTTGLALGAALAGGTSAYGRRGGIFGTLFAVTLLVTLMRYGDAANWRVAQLAWAGGAVGVGLVVTRLVEAFGRPRGSGAGVAEEQDWTGGTTTTADDRSWTTEQARRGGWSAQLPARSLDDTWAGDDRWGDR